MPMWLQKQMRRAYSEKDRAQIKLLNQCWFFYQKNKTAS
jgi:hypothetical protein